MEGVIRFETLDGKTMNVDAKAIREKSPYFEALLSEKWRGEQEKLFGIGLCLKEAKRIFSFALDGSGALKEKDKESFSYLFPGVPMLNAKEVLPFTEDTCKLLFPGSLVVDSASPAQKFGYYEFGMTGGYIVSKPHEGEVDVKDFVLGLGDFSATKVCYGYAGKYKCSASGFLLWCHVVISKQEEIVREMYKQTGLVVVPAHQFFLRLFCEECSLQKGGELEFFSERKMFFVCCDDVRVVPQHLEFSKYDNTKKKDLPWEHSKKVETLRAGVSFDKGFLLGENFPQEAEAASIRFEKE
ncbi:hypothetical protein A9K97_gp033 [Tokyovirus A1]|uniref:hypothetical protein n=1 Tax=Tokyovirus A1 TaxID=1826170 RepID=UPI0007A97C07|nr:hypothetical protein A9K97_gp033 [Tokyovirus A1]BAU80318.1 hypothetical protein [Tokyovirus A1]